MPKKVFNFHEMDPGLLNRKDALSNKKLKETAW